MFLTKLLKKKYVLNLMLFIALVCGAGPRICFAMPVNSHTSLNTVINRDDCYLEKVQNFLQKDIVQKKLAKLGLSKTAIDQYINNLDKVELQNLARKVGHLDSAGDSGLVVVLFLLLIVVSFLYFSDYAIKLEPRDK